MAVKYFLIFFFCWGFSYPILAQEEVSPKSHSPEVRKFEAKKLENYRQKREYIYHRTTLPPNPTLWERFMQWLSEFLYNTMNTSEKQTTWKWSLIFISAIIIVYVILRMMGADLTVWFYGESAKNKVDFVELAENIHEINFDKAIEEAIRQKKYRQAIRLAYLKGLKKLSDKKIIAWEKDKTNRDYLYEMGQNRLRMPFQEITRLFEYICYGDFMIDQQIFQSTQVSFQNFYQEIEKA